MPKRALTGHPGLLFCAQDEKGIEGNLRTGNVRGVWVDGPLGSGSRLHRKALDLLVVDGQLCQ